MCFAPSTHQIVIDWPCHPPSVYVLATPTLATSNDPSGPTRLLSHTDVFPNARAVAKSTTIWVGFGPRARWVCSGPPVGPVGVGGGDGDGG